ncbi:MAG: type II secretion system F family protein [Phycisphaeraceae bacterium]
MLESLLIGGLVFFAVVTVGGALVAVRASRRDVIRSRLQTSDYRPVTAFPDTPDSRTGPDGLGKALQTLGHAAGARNPSKRLEQELLRAGYYQPTAVAIFFGAKAVAFFGGLGLLTLITIPTDIAPMMQLMLIVTGAAALSVTPNIFLSICKSRREQEIRQFFPDAIDLLEICISSGMALHSAWNAVTEEVRAVSTDLADEMALTALETQLGVATHEALRHMADRTGAQEIDSLTSVIIQSERFGTSVAEALSTFAATVREERSMRAQEAAEKMAVKLILPMVLFIFPAVMIVMVGPAFLTLMRGLADL